MNEFKNKTILITGGTGTIGSELVNQLLKFGPKQIRVLSRDQNKQYHLAEELDHPQNLRLLVGDIRDENRLDLAFENVDIIFHAAALKHVPSCEYNAYEAVKTNIIGSQNIINVARKHRINKVIGISTDKAVNPNNVMGTTKLMMEKLFISADRYTGIDSTRFACVRFGNVAWASASVLPVWKKQIERSGEIRLTDSDMTRFLMSREQAVHLVIRAAELTKGGEVFIFKMPAIKMSSLANLFIKKYSLNKKIKIILTGNRGGEKQHEELFTNDSNQQVFEDKDMFIITPLFLHYFPGAVLRRYTGFKAIKNTSTLTLSSQHSLDEEKITKLL